MKWQIALGIIGLICYAICIVALIVTQRRKERASFQKRENLMQGIELTNSIADLQSTYKTPEEEKKPDFKLTNSMLR